MISGCNKEILQKAGGHLAHNVFFFAISYTRSPKIEKCLLLNLFRTENRGSKGVHSQVIGCSEQPDSTKRKNHPRIQIIFSPNFLTATFTNKISP